MPRRHRHWRDRSVLPRFVAGVATLRCDRARRADGIHGRAGIAARDDRRVRDSRASRDPRRSSDCAAARLKYDSPMRSAALLLLALLSINAGAQSPVVQTPESAFGFRMGTDGELADWPSLQRYFESTAAASDRVEL